MGGSVLNDAGRCRLRRPLATLLAGMPPWSLVKCAVVNRLGSSRT